MHVLLLLPAQRCTLRAGLRCFAACLSLRVRWQQGRMLLAMVVVTCAWLAVLLARGSPLSLWLGAPTQGGTWTDVLLLGAAWAAWAAWRWRRSHKKAQVLLPASCAPWEAL